MRRAAITAAAALAAAFALCGAVPHAGEAQRVQARLEGRYVVEGGGKEIVVVTRFGGDAYRLDGSDWEGLGFLEGASYRGVFRYRAAVASGPAAATGTHRATLKSDGSLQVHGEFTSGRAGGFDTSWRPERTPSPPVPEALRVPKFEHPVRPPDAPPEISRLPRFGEYVHVERLPEAVTKVPPVHPLDARRAGIEGTVVVQALVGEDGRIKDTRVVTSIPGLDEAAVAAVRQWVFRPAETKGKPVAVWVAVPVRFAIDARR